MRIIYILTALLLINLTIPAAYAQQAPVPDELLQEKTAVDPSPFAEPLEPDPRPMPGNTAREEDKKLPFDNYSDIPDEALADMQDYHKWCNENIDWSVHFDCECSSSRYLEERIKAGPNASRAQLLLEVNDECFNIPGAAGYAYDNCTKFGSTSYNGGMTPEQYCECTGSNYAILLQRSTGALTKRKMNSMMGSARLRCRASTPNTENFFRRLDNGRFEANPNAAPADNAPPAQAPVIP